MQIGRASPGKMRVRDPEMVEKLGEAGFERKIVRGISGGCYGNAPVAFTSAAGGRNAWPTIRFGSPGVSHGAGSGPMRGVVENVTRSTGETQALLSVLPRCARLR
ncbi:MAG: hypothetical protein ACREEZ_04105, partial [Stellaceae bacterium]